MLDRSHGYADVLVGLQYGDEGKAKVVDLIADQYDVIARFNGGANAGHTIVADAKPLALRQLPSGVFHPGLDLYIGSGCAVNAVKLDEEIRSVEARGYSLQKRLFIHPRAAIVQPHHLLLDQTSGKVIGTTGNGMGPCYADRALRMAGNRRLSITIGELVLDTRAALDLVAINYETALRALDGQSTPLENDMCVELAALRAAAERLRRFMVGQSDYLLHRVERGGRVLFEGAQSVGLDVVTGSIPYVTASHTVPGYAFVGGDIPPRYHRHTIGVAKAIMSRVGQGPFPGEFGGKRSELFCAEAARDGQVRVREATECDPKSLLRSTDPLEVGRGIRVLTGEYGTVTGRPRRVGMLDLVALRSAVKQTGTNLLFLNKCDCLRLFEESALGKIPVLVSYGTDPEDPGLGATVHYFDVWDATTHGVGSTQPMPEFLLTLTRSTGCEFLGYGFGPERNHNVVALDLLNNSDNSERR